MKFKKTSTALAAVLIGAAVFTTSALADVVVGSGYNSLKTAVKTTTKKIAGEIESFTAKASVELKVDGQIVEQVSDVTKVDSKNNRRMTENTGKNDIGYFSYWDSNRYISKYNNDETYYVTERLADDGDERIVIDDPFASDMAKDAEKVVDAFVGSLKDIVQVEESGGKRQYIGNLTETQVPPVANAVFSFVMKYGVLESYDLQEMGLPQITSDIYLKEASGKAIESENGMLESVIGSASIEGSDRDGVVHTITMEVMLELTDINATEVAAPDLTGKKVEVREASAPSGYVFDQRYIGVYKNDIVVEEDDAFRKVGERVLEITKVDDGAIEGRYHEDYVEGYTPEWPALDFTFSGIDKRGENTMLDYVDNIDGTAKRAMMYRDGMSGENLIFDLGIEISGDGYSTYTKDTYNRSFIRQFE